MQFCRPIFLALFAATTMAGCATSASDATTYSADDEKPRVTGSRIPIKDNSVANTKTMDKQSIDGMMRRGVTSAGGSN